MVYSKLLIMRYLVPIFLLFSMALHSPCQSQTVRRLLLFAGDTTDVALTTQREWLRADSAGVEERDIWIAVFTDPKTFRRMYEHHGAARHEFTLILIGKDGSEKLRSDKPVPTQELFKLIDSMPMRQVEMRNRSKKDQNDQP